MRDTQEMEEEDAGEVSRHKRHKQAPKGLSLREMLPRAKDDLGFGGGGGGFGGGTVSQATPSLLRLRNHRLSFFRPDGVGPTCCASPSRWL